MMRRVLIRPLCCAIVCIGLAACGARVDPGVRNSAARVVLGEASQGTSDGTQQSAPGTQTGPSAPSQSSTHDGNSAPDQTSGSAPTSQQQGSAHGHGKTPTSGHGTRPKSSGGGPSCPTSGTDVGLTSNTIDLGTIADLSGPVSGLFSGAVQGVETFANYVNNNGGICGHSVHVDVADSGTNCTQTENDASSLVSKDFALVGSFALYDNCMATVLKAHPTVADLHTGLSAQSRMVPNHYDIAAGTAGALTGPFAAWAKQWPQGVKNVGTIYENVPSAVAEQHAFEHAAESVGWKFTYQNGASPTTSNWTEQFQSMCGRQHVSIVFIETEPVQSAATMLENEQQAGCHNVINIIPVAYDQAFLPDYPGDASSLKVYGYNAFSLFFNANEAANIGEVKLFQQWSQRTFPGKATNLYSLYGWLYGRLFEQAFENAGSVANRKTVMASLNKIHNFSDNGMAAPSDPSSKTSGVHCYVLWQLSNSQFSRTSADPATGYRCDGRFLPYSGS